MANVTVVTSNPSITVDSTNSIITVGTTQSNIVVGATVNGTLANTIATSGRFSTLSVGNASTVQYTFPTADGTANQILKTNGSGVLTFVEDDGAVDSVNGQVGTVVLSTTDIAEGTNEYFTTARSRASISATSPALYDASTGVISISSSALFTGKTTDDLTEGSTNLYFTDARGDARVNLQTGTNLDLSNKNTGDLSEGSNLYFTNTRADDRVNLQTGTNLDLSNKSTTDVAEGTNLYYTDGRVDTRLSSGSISTAIKTTNAVHTNSIIPITGGNVTITGNLEVSGNINSVQVEDVLVKDHKIVLNYGNATARDAYITVDRSGSSLANANISWNETDDRFIFSDHTKFDDNIRVTAKNNNNPKIIFNKGASGADSYLQTTSSSVGSGLTTNEGGLTIRTDATTDATGGLGVTQSGGTAYLVHNGTADEWQINTIGDGTYRKIPQEGTAASFTTVTASVTGDTTGTHTGDVTGNVTGNLTGDSTGTHTGAVTGDVTGNLTGDTTGSHTGAVIGDVTGNLTGDSTGTHTGAVTGNLTGDVTGNLTGDVTGNLTGNTTGNVTTNRITADTDPVTNFYGKGIGGIQTDLFGSADPWRTGALANEQNWGQIAFSGFSFRSANNATYAGTSNIPTNWGFNAISTVGSPTISIHGVEQAAGYIGQNNSFPYSTTQADIDAALNSIGVDSIVSNGLEKLGTTGDFGFDIPTAPNTLRVVSIDMTVIPRTVTLNANAARAVDNSAVNNVNGNSITLGPGFYSTTTGLAVSVSNAEDVGGSGKAAIGFVSPLDFDIFGHTQYAKPSDFTGSQAASNGDALDLTQFGTPGNNIPFFEGTSKIDYQPNPTQKTFGGSQPAPVLNSPHNITIGPKTNTGNRAFHDTFRAFGLTTGYDGVLDTATFSRPPVIHNQIFQHVDNSAMVNNAYFRDVAGPRLFLALADGKSSTPLKQQFAKKGDELGRLQAWGRAENLATPSTYYANHKIGFNVSDFSNTNLKGEVTIVTTGEAGLKSVMGTDNGHVRGVGSSDITYLSGKEVHFKPLINNDGRYASGIGTVKHSAAVASSDVANTTSGSSLYVSHGKESRPSIIGDMRLGIKRGNNFSDWTMKLDTGTFTSNSGGTVNNNNYYPYFYLGNFGDGLRFNNRNKYNTLPEDWTDGMEIQLNGFTGGFGTTVNGNNYYGKVAFGVIMTLYSDAALTSPVTGLSTFGTDVDADKTGTIKILQSNFTAQNTTDEQEYYFMLENGNDSLKCVDRRNGIDIPIWDYDPVNRAVADAGLVTFSRPITTTQDITAGGFLGNLTGDSTGTHTGAVTGDVTGNLTGNVTGNVVGNLTGDVTGTVSSLANQSTSDLSEGTNLYYTTSRANTDIDARLSSGAIATISADDVTLKSFQETIINEGTVIGDISSNIDADDGSIFEVTAVGNITLNTIANAVAGTSMTLIIKQDSTGSRLLTAGNTIRWAGGNKTLSTAANATDLISIFYDGAVYYASLSRGYV
jgi:hypothetical protein